MPLAEVRGTGVVRPKRFIFILLALIPPVGVAPMDSDDVLAQILAEVDVEAVWAVSVVSIRARPGTAAEPELPLPLKLKEGEPRFNWPRRMWFISLSEPPINGSEDGGTTSVPRKGDNGTSQSSSG
jgi:hypothetical protein